MAKLERRLRSLYIRFITHLGPVAQLWVVQESKFLEVDSQEDPLECRKKLSEKELEISLKKLNMLLYL